MPMYDFCNIPFFPPSSACSKESGKIFLDFSVLSFAGRDQVEWHKLRKEKRCHGGIKREQRGLRKEVLENLMKEHKKET